MYCKSSKKTFLKFIITIFLFINCGYNQDDQDEAFFDGPHVFYNSDSLIVNYYNFGVKELFQLSINDTNIFNGYFQDSVVTYFIPKKFSTPSDMYHKVDRIFVVSDIHGQNEIFRKLLFKSGIIDQNNTWIWEDGHLVILGDVFDRGDQVHEALWLIYDLENQAREAGGKVHFLLGNHEIMVLQNDLRYVDKKYFTISEAIKIELTDLYEGDTFWGRWLRSKNFLTSIGPYLFVHGGIHPELIKKYGSITEINRMMSDNIDTERDVIRNDNNLSDLFRSKGPIWYRGFFEPDTLPEVSEDDLTDILEHFKVKKIIVGHTTQDSVHISYGQRIINVDSGIKYGIHGEGLLIFKDQFYGVDSNGSQRILF
ncbi:MAG: metallophosphoesterase [Candidatus Marinimicrobia bacterium]|nr:metallophosphoesterase [Candidatus Neomarinimicrobiota bacterium]